MVKTQANPGGLAKEVFDGFQTQVAANRAQFYRDLAAARDSRTAQAETINADLLVS
jgi:hypothetical protein